MVMKDKAGKIQELASSQEGGERAQKQEEYKNEVGIARQGVER